MTEAKNESIQINLTITSCEWCVFEMCAYIMSMELNGWLINSHQNQLKSYSQRFTVCPICTISLNKLSIVYLMVFLYWLIFYCSAWNHQIVLQSIVSAAGCAVVLAVNRKIYKTSNLLSSESAIESHIYLHTVTVICNFILFYFEASLFLLFSAYASIVGALIHN